MIIEQRIKDFEKLGFGVFVHFGAYSVLGRGEWARFSLKIPFEEYETYRKQFNPKPTWAKELAAAAKNAGARYITLTTRHHDGFSLYDTCGLNDYDAPHTCGRDLIREFVDACNAEGIIPFFYHTLLDWYHPDYNTDFPSYLKYLRASVELLCTRYGKIGGIWFDGKWNKPNDDWEEDALYGMIRKHQPDAMIINNTGLSARGALGHIELDSVTFERGRPSPLNLADSPKYIASEMCEVFNSHWGYAAGDLNYKAPADCIRDIVQCRRYGSNLLMNVGPMGDGSIRFIDAAMLDIMGQWLRIHDGILEALPCGIEVENKEDDFILEKDGRYYLFVDSLTIDADPNVGIDSNADEHLDIFRLDKEIVSVRWLDDGTELSFTQKDGVVRVKPTAFEYGRNLVVRVAEIVVK